MIELANQALELFQDFFVYCESKNEEEARLIQKLFFELGFGWDGGTRRSLDFLDAGFFEGKIYANNSKGNDRHLCYGHTHWLEDGCDEKRVKLSIKELSNLAKPNIVHANDINDGTRIVCGDTYLLTAANLYYFSKIYNQWTISRQNANFFSNLQAIDIPMVSFKPTTVFNEVW